MNYSNMEVVTTTIEHASILSVCAHLETLGVTVKYLPVDGEGRLQISTLEEALTSKTALVTIHYVNSEIGVVQPIAKCVRIVREKEKVFGIKIPVHVDAAQAPLWLSCALDALQCDSLTLDAGKCYGPKGVGVLAFRQDFAFEPYFFGGSQEGGYRPSTENIALIVGASQALCIAQEHYEERSKKVASLRDRFFSELLAIENLVINGSREYRVANNVHTSVLGVESEFAVVSLNEKGIACATKSACGGARGDGSSVVHAIYNDSARATSTIRFTLGEETTPEELSYVVEVLNNHIKNTRKMNEKLTIV